MPIVLDDLDITTIDVAAGKGVDPKFFSSHLTGTGRPTKSGNVAAGVLNHTVLPVNLATNTAYRAHEDVEVKSNYTQSDITTSMIPMGPIMRRALLATATAGAGATVAPFTATVPSLADAFEVETGSSDWDVFFDMTVQAAVYYQDTSGAPKRDLVVQYRMELFFFKKGTTIPDRVRISSPAVGYGNNDAAVFLEWNTSPLTEALSFIEPLLMRAGLSVRNKDDLDLWMREYNVYDHITSQADAWASGEIAKDVCAYISELPLPAAGAQLNALCEQLRYLENYNIPLEAYREIHRTLEATFPSDVSETLSKQNLNLLMNHTLYQLEQMKPQLGVAALPTGPISLPSHLSKQQVDALTTHEPLVMTQAGAGTGKSTVILQRIDYLAKCGVQESDITVLSFTNAAADNIIAKNPAVGSMTIARMVHDIYSMNHPTHEPSSVDTIINSIDIFYPNDSFAAAFRSLLLKVEKNDAHSYTALNTFVENHYDEVIALLDRIKQTSLILEIIVCYQKIDTMAEPAHVQCKHLIIDEVQDNSIFEFIYLLKYVSKHLQTLFIVGDASQTLYEFRSANPRALNTLESSGVFATFKLTTNYRSNQEILDFANVVLGGLETNQFANIQLQANSLAVPTADTFQEKVTLDYREFNSQKGFREEMSGIVRNTIVPKYVQYALDKGEQVAFLARNRADVKTFMEVLQAAYPDRHVANLVSEKTYATDVFSKYIKNFWNEVLQVQPNNASFVVSKGIIDNLDKLTRNADKSEAAVKRMVSNWWLENSAVINAWVALAQAGHLPADEFFDRLRDNMLSFEIHHNAVRQALTNQKNREQKEKNTEAKADLVVSTIHGAKGLEFDHVVVLHKEDTQMSEEEKRLYYVAFTRAMKSMFVLSFGSWKNPPIESNYKGIVATLEERDAARATALAGRASGVGSGADAALILEESA